MVPGAKAPTPFHVFYAALKRRSSTVVEADGVASEGLLVDPDSRFLSGFAGSE